jgi:serine/threonine protein kinase
MSILPTNLAIGSNSRALGRKKAGLLPARRGAKVGTDKLTFRYGPARPSHLTLAIAAQVQLLAWLRLFFLFFYRHNLLQEGIPFIDGLWPPILLTFLFACLLVKQTLEGLNCYFQISDRGLTIPAKLLPFGWLLIFNTWEWRNVLSILLYENTKSSAASVCSQQTESRFILVRLHPFWKIKINLDDAFTTEECERFMLGLYQFSERAKMNATFIKEAERIETATLYLPVPFSNPSEEKPVDPPKQRPPSLTALWDLELQRTLLSTSYAPLSAGTIVRNGEYVVTEHLASGGQSTTYCIQNTAGESLVLKESVFPEGNNKAISAKARELFAREARLLLKCNHPRIARVYDHFVENGRDYLVLQRIKGLSLGKLVRSRGKVKEREALAWASEILDILTYLHSMSPPIIHRDLTPDNLICSEEGKIFLIDFGAANDALSTATGTLIGKQPYIPPEQFRGKPCPSSDIYALGGALHFLVTGEEPIPLSVSHPRAINPLVSPDLNQFIERCTHQDEHERPDTASCLQIVTRLRKGQFIQGL